jgi:Spy/CpxP family protein refolding chaperone
MNSMMSARLALAALALALVGAALSPAEAAPDTMLGGPPEHAERMADRMLAGASGVTDAQRSQVREIARAAATDLRAQHDAGRTLREQMAAAFTQPVVDANAVEALRQKMLAQHDATSKRMTQALLDVSRVLTPEQRQQIAQKLQSRRSMMERHRGERQQLEGGPAR